MSRVTSHMSVSLDGFVAGPDQSRENPIGVGGMSLHQWHIGPEEERDPVDADFARRLVTGKGAYVMGRNMYGPIRGDWGDDEWQGWWGPEPPYHAPVFVLTHHEHEPIEMEGGTTFHFVTDGIESALAQATEVAGDLDVDIAGGASAVRQALRAGAVDELTVDVVPVLLGSGERLLDDVGPLRLEQVEVAHSPLVTHVRYRVTKS